MPQKPVKRFLILHSKFLGGSITDSELLELGELSEVMDRMGSDQQAKKKNYKTNYKFKKRYEY